MRSDYEKLINYAFLLLAKKRYTTHEISKKFGEYLKRHGLSKTSDEAKTLIHDVLDRLFELKYLDDKQFASDYINQRIEFHPRGQYLLKRELKLKGIDEETISALLKDKQIDESAVAMKALIKKQRAWLKEPINKQREKAFRFLSSRGFKPDTIYRTVDSCYSGVAIE